MGASRAAMRKMAKDRFWDQDDHREDQALLKIAKDLAHTETYKSLLNCHLSPAGALLPCGHHTTEEECLCSWDCECGQCLHVCVACNQIVNWSA